MLGLLLWRVAAVVVVAAVAGAIIVKIHGMLNQQKTREILKDNDITVAIIKDIIANGDCKTCKVEDLYSDKVVEIECDDIDSTLNCGDKICV